MGVMGTRGLVSGVLVSVCALVCVLVASTGPAWAAGGTFQFGPVGSEAGGLKAPAGMAVDARGETYVGESEDQRVSKFDASGNFLFAWGWGVANGVEELQTCTTSCQAGKGGQGAGEFRESCGPQGVAVDSDPLSASYNDVYVVDFCNRRVQKFGPSGEFLSMFGGHVNKNGTDVCVAGEEKECEAGTEGTGDGEFSWAYEKAYIAVGEDGDVYVGDKARVQVFEPSGAWKENISLSALSSEGKVTALAASSAGDVYVKDEGVPGVREFEQGGMEMPIRLDEAGGEAVESIALDGSGDVFISENRANGSEPCKCDFLEYGPSGEELERFGGNTLVYILLRVSKRPTVLVGFGV